MAEILETRNKVGSLRRRDNFYHFWPNFLFLMHNSAVGEKWSTMVYNQPQLFRLGYALWLQITKKNSKYESKQFAHGFGVKFELCWHVWAWLTDFLDKYETESARKNNKFGQQF